MRTNCAISITIVAICIALIASSTLTSFAVPESGMQNDSDSLRKMLLSQPNFAAEIRYDKDAYDPNQPGLGVVKRVMMRDNIFRFEVITMGEKASSPMVILGFPGKEIRAIDPREKTWSIMSEDDLSRAAFTLLIGVDSYYLTKAIMSKATELSFVSDEAYRGHKCIKIRASNKELPSGATGFEAMWFMNGPLYFHLAKDLDNLIIAVTGQDQQGKPADVLVFENISLDPEQIPKAQFEIPAGFRERK